MTPLDAILIGENLQSRRQDGADDPHLPVGGKNSADFALGNTPAADNDAQPLGDV
jgi:hypothetical protein